MNKRKKYHTDNKDFQKIKNIAEESQQDLINYIFSSVPVPLNSYLKDIDKQLLCGIENKDLLMVKEAVELGANTAIYLKNPGVNSLLGWVVTHNYPLEYIVIFLNALNKSQKNMFDVKSVDIIQRR